jgi:hypothetical protein
MAAAIKSAALRLAISFVLETISSIFDTPFGYPAPAKAPSE